MPIILARVLRVLRPLVTGWVLALTIAAVVFLSSWLAMWLVEPDDNTITSWTNYPWYFIVTAATVGYGDFFPKTALGHVVGAYVIVGGIVSLTILFTRLADRIQTVKGNRMRGLADLDVRDHIVLLGYTPGRTERLVHELVSEEGVRLALVAWDDVHEHPLPDLLSVLFVRGEPTEWEVLKRANVRGAKTVIVDGRDDNESLAIAVAVAHASRPTGQRGAAENRTQLIVALRDMSRAPQFQYVSSRMQCVQWHVPNLLVEEAHDPGISQVYGDLMSAGGSGNTYSLQMPKSFDSFGDLQTRLGSGYGATAVAVRSDSDLRLCPSWREPVAAGTTVYYVAPERIDAGSL